MAEQELADNTEAMAGRDGGRRGCCDIYDDQRTPK